MSIFTPHSIKGCNICQYDLYIKTLNTSNFLKFLENTFYIMGKSYLLIILVESCIFQTVSEWLVSPSRWRRQRSLVRISLNAFELHFVLSPLGSASHLGTMHLFAALLDCSDSWAMGEKCTLDPQGEKKNYLSLITFLKEIFCLSASPTVSCYERNQSSALALYDWLVEILSWGWPTGWCMPNF